MRRLQILVFLLVFAAIPLAVNAQTVQAVVTGTVFDPAGAVIPGATVTLTNPATNISQTVTTGADGSYRFSLVPPGTYTVRAKAAGFTEKAVSNLTVEPSKQVPLNITLEVGPTATTVEVTAGNAIVQTATSDLAATVNRTAIINTPLITRNVYDLAFLAAPVTQGMNFNPASGGARESGTAFLLNGADNNDNFSEGAVNITPPLETVNEFTILTNSMNPQYGRAAGAIISVSQKSGTNNLHGVLYEFNRNRSLNASDFFQNRQGSPKPKYIRNQFGGEVDGPILKDRSFFAFAFDRISPKTGSETNTQVPTLSEVAAIRKDAGPIAKYYLDKYPQLTPTGDCPNQARDYPDSIGHIGCVHLFNPVTQPQNNYYGRVDHVFSDRDRVSFTANITRWQYNEKYGGGHPSTTSIPYLINDHYHNLSLVQTHMFGPRLVNEFALAHNRHFDVGQAGDGKIRDPEIGIDGQDYGYLGFGFSAYEGLQVVGFVQDRWQVQDNVALTAGKHSFKFGGGWQYGIVYRNWDLGLPGYYEFGNVLGATPQSLGYVQPDGTIAGVADTAESNFQHDFPYFQEIAIDSHTGKQASAYRHYIMKDANLFVNDDWKVSRRLMLNLGLRWERFGAPTEANGIVAQLTNFNCTTRQCIAAARIGPVKSMWNTRNHDFAPRVGFAWDLFGNGKMSVRGGYGISYDRIFDNVWSNGAWNPPFYALAGFDATSTDAIFYSAPPKASPSYEPDSLPGSRGRVSVRTMENNLKDSSVQNFYFGIERQLRSNYLVRVNYQGSLGRHLPVLMNWNRTDGQRYNATLTNRRPNSLYTGFNYRSNNVTSNYNALVAEVQRRFSNGLQFQVGYTFSKLIDLGSDLFTGETLQGSYSQPYYFVSNSRRDLEHGLGAFDHKHGFKVSFTYELPFWRAQNGPVGKILGGWQISGFYQAYTGHPVEVYNGRTIRRGNVKDANGIPENLGGDYNLDGVQNDHPIFVGTSASAAYSGKSPADGIFTDNNKIGCGFAGQQSTNTAACNDVFGVETPNKLFVNPPGTGVRFGMGRNLFRGPNFNGFDAAIFKNIKVTERHRLQLRFEAVNLPNHPNFDYIDTNLNSGQFGKAQGLATPARRMQLGIRYYF